MRQSLRWCVVVCATIGVFSLLGTPTALGQTPLPRQNEAVVPWFIPLAESVDGIWNGRDLTATNGSGQTAGGVIYNVSAILAASPTASVIQGARGRVNNGEDGFVNPAGAGGYYDYHKIDRPNGVFGGWPGKEIIEPNFALDNPNRSMAVPRSILYRFFVNERKANINDADNNYGPMIGNLQGNDTLVMAAVVANVNQSVVSRLKAGTLSPAEYAGLLQGVTADFRTLDPAHRLDHPKKPGEKYTAWILPPLYNLFPTSATGVSQDVRDSTLVVFTWDGSKTSTPLIIPATAVTDTDKGLRAYVGIVAPEGTKENRQAPSNYVGIDHTGPALDTALGGITIPTAADINGNNLPQWLKQTNHMTVAQGLSSEIRWGDLITVQAAIDVNHEQDGEPDAYFKTGGSDYLGDATGKNLPRSAGIVNSTSLTTGNIAAAILRRPAYATDVKAWTINLGSPPARVFPTDEDGIFYGTLDQGTGLEVPAAASNWGVDPIILRARFVVNDAITGANANYAGDIGNNAMPINFVIGDELGLHHKSTYSIGGAGFSAAAVANISNGTIVAVTGYVDNRPPVIVRADLSPHSARRIVGASSTYAKSALPNLADRVSLVGVQVDFSLEEEPVDRLGSFTVTIDPSQFTSTPAAPFAVTNAKIAGVRDLADPANYILGASATGFFWIDGTVASNKNAGVVVTVVDDARNDWTFDSVAPGGPWEVMGVNGTPKVSTLVLDRTTPSVLGAVLYTSENIPTGSAVGNGEIMTVLKTLNTSTEDPYSAGTILGATLASVESKIRLKVYFDPSSSNADDIDTNLAQYPDISDSVSKDLADAWRRKYSYTKPNSSNILGVNASGGLFNVHVTIPELNLLPAAFSVVRSVTAGDAALGTTVDRTYAILEATVPPLKTWARSLSNVTPTIGIPITAVVQVKDFPYNTALAAGTTQAVSTGITADTAYPKVLALDKPQETRAVTELASSNLLFAVMPQSVLPNDPVSGYFDPITGPTFDVDLRRAPYNVTGLGQIVPLDAGDVVLVRTWVQGAPPTFREGQDLTGMLPPVLDPPFATMLWPRGIRTTFPKLTSATFRDFINSATAIVPVSVRTLDGAGNPYVPDRDPTDARPTDRLLLTFAHRITGTDLNRSLAVRDVRSVTVNMWDVAGNVSSQGIFGATADFGAPDITIVSFKMNGVAVSSIVDPTVSIGDNLEVVAKVDPAGSGRINKVYANFGDFGLATEIKHNQRDEVSNKGKYKALATSGWGRRVDGTFGPVVITEYPIWPADSRIGAASIVYVTFTYTGLEDTNVARSDKEAKVNIVAINTSNVAGTKDTAKVGVDLNAPNVRVLSSVPQIFQHQVQPTMAPGDSLWDNFVRVGDVLRVTAAFQLDAADGNWNVVKSVTPEADFSKFGLPGWRLSNHTLKFDSNWLSQGPTLFATWTVTVGNTGVTEGTTGPWDVTVRGTDRVGNQSTTQTDTTDFMYFIENGRPTFVPSDIVLQASNEANWTGGVFMSDTWRSMAQWGISSSRPTLQPGQVWINQFYTEPKRKSAGSIVGTPIGMDTVGAGDVVLVTANISLNDDPNKVQIDNSQLWADLRQFDPAKTAVNPNGRIGTSAIKAFWSVNVSPQVPSSFGVGASVAVTAKDTAGLSNTVASTYLDSGKIKGVTIEVDTTPPDVVLLPEFYAKGKKLADPTIISGRTEGTVTVGSATFSAVVRATYNDGGSDTASWSSTSVLKDLPGLAMAGKFPSPISVTPTARPGRQLVRLKVSHFGQPDSGPTTLLPDLITLTGDGPTVYSTSGTFLADIQNTTNRVVTYYYANAQALPGRPLDKLDLFRGKRVYKAGYQVGGSSGLSRAVAKLIGYASDDIGNVTPTSAVVDAVASAGTGRSALYAVELDNTQPRLSKTAAANGHVYYTNKEVSSTAGGVGEASLAVVVGADKFYEPLQPAVNSGDIVEVSFAVRDPVNDTKPIRVTFNMQNFIKSDWMGATYDENRGQGDSSWFTDLSVTNSPNATGSWSEVFGIYTVTGIEPVNKDTVAEGKFKFRVGDPVSSDPVAPLNDESVEAIRKTPLSDRSRPLGKLAGTTLVIDATDAIGVNHRLVAGSYLQSITMELDNEAALYKSTKPGVAAILVRKRDTSAGGPNADVHVTALQPGDSNYRFLDPPSVIDIAPAGAARPTLIRASATIFSDSLVWFKTDLLDKYNGDGRTRVAWYPAVGLATPALNATRAVQLGPTAWVLNATVQVLPGADPMQPQHITMTAYDQVGNAGQSDTANLLGINAQGVFMLESMLYVNGVNVTRGYQGGAAHTPGSAADRRLSNAGVDELRPGDVLQFASVLSHDVRVPDEITASFTDFYPPQLAGRVNYLVPSATHAGAGNTTIATWTISTVDVQPWSVTPRPRFANLLFNNPVGEPTPLWQQNARQGLRPIDFAQNQISIDPTRAAMSASQAPHGLDVLGSPNIAVQQVWNIDRDTGVRPNKVARVVVTATDYQSLFPSSSLPSTSVIVDSQPPEVIVRANPTVPFRNHPDDPPNRVRAGDKMDVFIRLMNATVDGQSDDHWWPTQPGQLNTNNPVVSVNVSDLGVLQPQPLVPSTTVQTVTATIYEAQGQYTVGSNVGNSDAGQQRILNIVISASDDVGNNAVEIIHEQPMAVDNWPPSIYPGSLGVRLLAGEAQTAAGDPIPVGGRVSANARVAPGSILRVSAVIGDTLDDPLTFLSSDRISLDTSGIASAGVKLATEIATISRTNLSAPFNVTLPPADQVDTTIFGFAVSVTDALGNSATEVGIGRFYVNGRPIVAARASTSDGILVSKPVADGGTATMNADSVLTLLVGAYDLGVVNALDVTTVPPAPVGSDVAVSVSDLGVSSVTATITVTPQVPVYGAAAPQDILFTGTATDDDNYVGTLSGITVAINTPALFSGTFQGTLDSAAVEISSTDLGLSAAGADVREVTMSEGSVLTVLLDAADTAAPNAIVLEVTGTAISSSAVIAGVTLAGQSVLNAPTAPTVAIAGTGQVAFNFDPGYKAIPYGSTALVAKFTLRASVADSLQTRKDWVDLVINVLPKSEAPIVRIADVTLYNADGIESKSLGAVASAQVQESSTAVITVSASDLGGEPVTLTAATDTSLTGVFTPGTPAAGAATVGVLRLTVGLNDADVPASGLDVATDPTNLLFTGTNASGLAGSAVVALDLLNLPQPPVLAITGLVSGKDIGVVGDSIDVKPGDTVVLNIRATDSDGELVILAASGMSGLLATQPPQQGLIMGTYTFSIPADLTQDTVETVTITATDGGFRSAKRTIAVTILVGNHAPVLTVTPAETTVAVGESVVITLTATDIDGDVVVFSQSPEIGVLGTVTKVDKVSTVGLTVTGAATGVLTSVITVEDPAGLADSKTVTVTVTPAIVPAQVVLSQGHGGTTINKIVRMPDFSRVVGFAGLPAAFAAALGDPRNRAANTAVADFNGDGVKDVVVAFGVSGQGSKSPSILVVWSPVGGPGGGPKAITSGAAFATTAVNELLRNPFGAVNVAVGNVLGEGPMIVAAQGDGGRNIIRVLRLVQGADGRWKLETVGEFQGLTGAAARENTSGGTAVACGDLDGDGLDEVVVGQTGSANAANSTLFQVVDLHRDPATGKLKVLRQTAAVAAMPVGYRGLGGINLAVGDVNGDRKLEIITATAGDPAGAKGDPTLKNYVRVFGVTVDALNRISVIKAITPALRTLGADLNPSGGIDIAAGNLDDDRADEILVGTQAIVTLDTATGAVTVTNAAPEALVKGYNLEFDEVGVFKAMTSATDRVKAFGGVNKPTSGAVNVQIYPVN